MNKLTSTAFPLESQESEVLTDLALDLAWSWNHSADEVPATLLAADFAPARFLTIRLSVPLELSWIPWQR